MIGRLLAVVGAVLALPVVLIVLVAAASGSPAAATGLAGSATLNNQVIPNPTWVPWVQQAGSLCSTFSTPVIAAQIDIESSWNPVDVSSAGAEGLAQFMPGTWPSWGRNDAGDGNVSPFNPPDAIMAMGRYDCALAAAVAAIAQHSGQTVLTLALDAYNAGLGAVRSANGIPKNPQTEMYAPSVETLAAAYAMQMGPAGPTAFGAAEITAAQSQLGVPYVWGGGGPSGPTDRRNSQELWIGPTR